MGSRKRRRDPDPNTQGRTGVKTRVTIAKSEHVAQANFPSLLFQVTCDVGYEPEETKTEGRYSREV
jgi:hypothetical protein